MLVSLPKTLWMHISTNWVKWNFLNIVDNNNVEPVRKEKMHAHEVYSPYRRYLY